LAAEVATVLGGIPIDTGGGCSVPKACVLAELIRRYRLRASVDIGVYRGRSFFPQALAHARATGGVAYGVDPWSAVESVQHDMTPEVAAVVAAWEPTVDFDAVYQDVVALRDRLGLAAHSVLVRRPSSEATADFARERISFGLVHIDGNHDTVRVRQDVDLYLPLLLPTGFLVVDDISWPSIQLVYTDLCTSMTVLYEGIGAANDYAVMWRGQERGAVERRRVIDEAIREAEEAAL
jgi:hypothetical protein